MDMELFASIIEKYKLEELEEVLDQIEETIIQNKDRKHSEEITLLLFSVGKSIIHSRETLILCSRGYPDGALCLARNIYEQFIHLAYISGLKDEIKTSTIEKYNDDYIVQRAKALIFEAKHITHSTKSIENYNAELDKIKVKYSKTSLNNYWWSDVNSFAEMYKDVARNNVECEQLLNLLHLLYKRSSICLHASCIGNRIRLGSDFCGVDMGPWDVGQEIPLFMVCESLIFITGLIYRVLEIDDQTILKRLNFLALRYQNMIQLHSAKLDDF